MAGEGLGAAFDAAEGLRAYADVGCDVVLGDTGHELREVLEEFEVTLLRGFGIEGGEPLEGVDKQVLGDEATNAFTVGSLLVELFEATAVYGKELRML